MLEKLRELALRYEDLQAQLADPTVYGDADRLRTVNRELKELAPVAEAYEKYRRAEADRSAAEALLSDPEMRELAQEELTAARQEMERLHQELKLLLLPKDPNDRKNVILEIRAGTGGEEAALFAASLLRMYTKMCIRDSGRVRRRTGRCRSDSAGRPWRRPPGRPYGPRSGPWPPGWKQQRRACPRRRPAPWRGLTP